MNKTLIIGHTSGIGKEIHRIFKNSSGVSKSTGFDINTNITKFFDYSEYQCVILNAIGLTAFAQIKTFFDILESDTWNKNKLLIVMSSISAWKETSDTLEKIKYSVEKNAINKASRNANSIGYHTSVVCPGFVNTAWNKYRTDVEKLSTKTVSLVTKQIYDMYFDNGILMNEIVLEKKGQK